MSYKEEQQCPCYYNHISCEGCPFPCDNYVKQEKKEENAINVDMKKSI